MKKNVVFGLLIITLSILVFAACGGTPAPKPEPVTESAPPPPPPATVVGNALDLTGATNYTVVQGDTLSEIAARRYGGSNMYFFPLIRLANEAAVPNPDEIEVGTVLVIPVLQRNLDNPGANALIRVDTLRAAEQYERLGKPQAAQELRNLATRLSR
jgi:Tfp pilus assembly protein FimV